MITIETLTDAQVYELRDALNAEGARGKYAYCVPSPDVLAQLAVGTSARRHAARVRCVELINAREAVK